MCKFRPESAANVSFWLMVPAVFGVLIATVCHDALEKYVDNQLTDHFVVTSASSPGFGAFANTSDPDAGIVISSYWANTITNAYDVVTYGAKPRVVELGPLRYSYTNMKYNVTWPEADDGDTMRYMQYQYYLPLDAATVALENTVITTLNVPLLAALNFPAAVANFVPILFPQTKNDMSLFANITIRELLWGYTDPVLQARFPGLQNNDTSLDYAMSQHSPTTVYTGKITKERMMEMVTWDGMEQMECCTAGPQGEKGSGGGCAPIWSTPEASNVRGSFGAQFAMHLTGSETLNIATYDFGIYRHWPLQCTGQGSIPWWNPGYDFAGDAATLNGCEGYEVEGIQLFKYALPAWVLGNASVNSDEAAGYNVFGPSGLLNQSSCEQSAPLFLSLPHFLYGSNELLEAHEGMSPPDPAIHGSWLGIEPTTGQALDFHFRVGINVQAKPVPLDPLGTPYTYWPALSPIYYQLGWGQQESSIQPDQADRFKSQVYLGLKIQVASRWLGFGLAAASLLIGLILRIAMCRAARKGVKATAGGDIEYMGLGADTEMGGNNDRSSRLLADADALVDNGGGAGGRGRGGSRFAPSSISAYSSNYGIGATNSRGRLN